MALYVGRVFRIGPVFALATVLVGLITISRTGFALAVPMEQALGETGRWLSIGILGVGPLNGDDDAPRVMAGVTWTLQYEWAFYAALVPMALGALNRRAVLPFTAVIMAASLWWCHRGGPSFLDAHDATMALLLSIGMGAAALESEGLMPRRVPAAGLSCAVLALVILVFVLFPIGYGIAPILMLGIAFYAVLSGGTLFGLLTGRPARRLGDISYGIYLLQGPVLTAVFAPRLVRTFALSSPAAFWVVVLGTAVALVSLATLAHALLERPGIRAGRQVMAALRRRRVRRIVVAPTTEPQAGRTA